VYHQGEVPSGFSSVSTTMALINQHQNNLLTELNKLHEHLNTIAIAFPPPLRFNTSNTISTSAEYSLHQVFRATAIFQFTKTRSDELSIQLGESLTVLDSKDISGWWKVRNSQGELGMVPHNYLKKL